MITEPSDQLWIEEILEAREGWDHAWRMLMLGSMPQLRAVARHFRLEVDDLKSDLLLHLQADDWKRLRTYQARADSRFSSWLSRVAFDLAWQRARKELNRAQILAENATDIVRDRPEPGPEEEMMQAELLAALQESLAQLRHPRCQEILRRRYYLNESLGQIAYDMGLNEPNVRKIHQRNKEELSEILRRKGWDIG